MLRRNILSALSLLLVTVAAVADAPRYIFYFIGDGMGMGAVSLAQLYSRTVLGSEGVLNMMTMPVASMATTHSASSPVTDSAAAGTALATGNKTINGMLGVTPDSAAVISIAKILHDNGYGVGLVTTVAPDDATPGAFYAHQPHRSMFYEIGKDAAMSGYEFIAGANLRGTKDKDGYPNDLLAVFEENKVSVVRGTDALKEAKYDRVLLLNTDSLLKNDVGYAIDSVTGVLTLPAMTEACIQHLQKQTPDRFFMMVEGGSIDHAAHPNDAATVAIETIAFDTALALALDFYREHPEETLIIVTADHETGGLCLANRKLHYDVKPGYLKYQNISKERFIDLVESMMHSRMVYEWSDLKSLIQDRVGLYGPIPVDEAGDKAIREAFDNMISLRSGDPEKLHWAVYGFAGKVFEEVSWQSGIGWTTGDHSGAMVPVYAIGVGADRFAGAQDNTDIPKKILEIAGY